MAKIIATQKELSDFEKITLVRKVLHALTEEKLSTNQIIQILKTAQEEAGNIPIINLIYKKND